MAGEVGWCVAGTLRSTACRGGLLTDHMLHMKVEGCPVVVGGVVHVGGRLERLVFLQLMARACSLQLDIGVGNRSVVVLQLRGAGVVVTSV